MKGVEKVVVGYSGGKKKHPTYTKIKDSTESLLIEFDPEIVTYETLLDKWSKMNFPETRYPSKRQYRSVIFYNSEQQRSVAQTVLQSIRTKVGGGNVYVDVEPVTAFYQAEEYHQNYLLKTGLRMK